ncbi:hypothetical protein [Arenimonas composti]|uniref:Multidrug transporter n=1 Tax=Arenimonas composti TR7-09 = DSM 18010 TaxID=1121013 RepID=A0A091BZN6_9GAMM|nr:hypothetical protein [Arenimonas composti]KFN49825.1 hypothetical protein P873_08875 [Arenimonas composti TR7-09 = DSM 18010]
MTLAYWLWAAALLLGLIGLAMLLRRGRGRGGAGRLLRRLLGLLLVLAALVTGGAGLLLRHWSWLVADLPVARITLKQEAPQRFRATLVSADAPAREYVLLGDEWQLDARVLRWALPARFTLSPVYRLERLGGRYGDPKQELDGPRSVHDLRRDWDFWEFHQRWLATLPIADARFGSAAYLPMLDGATYDVFVSPGGGLVAKPADAATEGLLREAGW